MPKKMYWIIGAAIALAGVAVTRVIAPELPEDMQFIGKISGATIAVVGIFVAALGAGRTSDRPHSNDPSQN